MRELRLFLLVASLVVSNLVGVWGARTLLARFRMIYGGSYKTHYRVLPERYTIFPNVTGLNTTEYPYFLKSMDFDSFEDSILLGGADKLYLIDGNLTLRDKGVYSWPSSSENARTCVDTFEDPDNYICRNHMRVVERHPSDRDNLLFMCGSQAAGITQCRALNVSDGNLEGEATPPSDMSGFFMSTHPDYPTYGTFRGTTPDDTSYLSWSHLTGGVYPHRFNRQHVTFNETTQLFSNTIDLVTAQTWLDEPGYLVDVLPISFRPSDFVRSVRFNPNENYDYYFLFLREGVRIQVDQTVETVLLSYIARICKNDAGQTLTNPAATNVFGSFFKTRFFCQQERPAAGENPLGALSTRFHDLWSVALNDRGRSFPTQVYNRKMYAAFSTAVSGVRGSAVCSYVAEITNGRENVNFGIYDSFFDDLYLHDDLPDSLDNTYPSCIANLSRPAESSSTIRTEDVDTVEPIAQLGNDPLLILNDLYVLQIAVDEVCVVDRVDRSICYNQDVLFLGVSSGHVLKVVFSAFQGRKLTPILSEEIALDDDAVIKDMKISDFGSEGRRLFVSSYSHVYRLTFDRCERLITLYECIEARDPYCVWNTTAAACQTTPLSTFETQQGVVPPNILQNVHFGYVLGLFRIDSLLCGSADNPCTFTEGEFPMHTLRANASIPEGWIEVTVADEVMAVQFSQVNITVNETANLIEPAWDYSFNISYPNDEEFAGDTIYTIPVRNTAIGAAVITVPDIYIRVIDDDGIYGQVGLVGISDPCVVWKEKGVSLEPVNEAIFTSLGSTMANWNIASQGIYCAANESRLKVAIYRFSIVAPDLGVDWEAVRREVQIWVFKEVEVKLDDGTVAKIDHSCNTNISSLDDPLCSLVPITLPLASPQPGAAIGGEGVAAIIVSMLLAAMVCVCVLLIILLYRTYKKTMHSSKVSDNPPLELNGVVQRRDQNGKKPEDQGKKLPPKESPRHIYENPDHGHPTTTKDDYKRDLSLAIPTATDTTTAPQEGEDDRGFTNSGSSAVADPTSAVPLIKNGTEVKRFSFPKLTSASPKASPKDHGKFLPTDSPLRSGSAGSHTKL